MNKKIEELLFKVLVECYLKATPSVNLKDIPREELRNRIDYRAHYLDPKVEEEILAKHLKGLSEVNKRALKINLHLGAIPMSRDFYFELQRTDGLVKTADKMKWVIWDKKKKPLYFSDFPEIGSSILLSPFNHNFTWLTTEVTEMLNDYDEVFTDEGFKFKTKNSEYKLIRKLK